MAETKSPADDFAATERVRLQKLRTLQMAAPDLLASLKEMEDMLHEWMQDNTGPRELDILERCEKAIARAEGR